MAIPLSIREEHRQLHKELSGLINVGGPIGRASNEVANALHKHFIKEEKYAMPNLGVLHAAVSNRKITNVKSVIRTSVLLEKHLPGMLKEHTLIVKKLDKLKKVAMSKKDSTALNFVDKLKHHALTEEEVLYPAAILIGKYLSTKKEV